MKWPFATCLVPIVPLLAQIDAGSWLEMGKQAPSLAVLVFALWMFLRHLDAQDTRRDAADKRRDELMDKIDARRDAADVRRNEVIARVSVSYDRNTEVLGRTVQALDRVEDIIVSNESGVRVTAPGAK